MIVNNSINDPFEQTHHTGAEPHLLREVFRTYQVLMAAFSRKTGMPASRFALMRILVFAEREMGIMDIARQLGINAAAVTRQIKELESEGLVRRRADSKDGRRSYIRLSSKGHRLFEQIHERTHELEQSLSSVLGAEQMQSAAVVLTKLRAFIEGHG
jgi:DNA-binding MarR family transcriptional regulator